MNIKFLLSYIDKLNNNNICKLYHNSINDDIMGCVKSKSFQI